MRKEFRVLAGCVAAALAFSGCTQSNQTKETTTAPVEETTAPTQTTEPVTEPAVDPVPQEQVMIDLTGYTQVWEDTFDDGISEDDWNYELHEPGWVNNELQAYVKSEDNVYVEDGVLVIKPVKTVADNGTVSYTSGRVNTQGKHDFTYGIFEASIKMPAGQGFLPAFWMMPTDENLYGQWPRCGEIDIAEVLGNETNKAYGTVHYGNPHSESQGAVTLKDGDFASEFHTYAVEWLPGQINWYIDGALMHSENDWYTTTEGLGTVTYPAPFDQPFYMILNLAVGGNWPGNPDDTTDFDAASMQIDYVRVYQKDSYDENVSAPVKDNTLRDPDATGNYIGNGDFSVAEDLDDKTNWNFLTTADGKGQAVIENNEIVISSTSAGTEDYSVQLVSWDVPMKDGSTYKITFDAYAEEARQFKVAVTAPTRGWIRYYNDTAYDLTTEKQSYSIEFTVDAESDPQGRLEFNMGNQGSTATIHISNVRVEMTNDAGEVDKKKDVLSDGNYVYNASFQEGTNRVGEWIFEGSKNYAVTDLADGRRLKVTNGEGETLKVYQKDLALSVGTTYMLSFEAELEEGKPINVYVDGDLVSADEGHTIMVAFTYTGTDASLVFEFGEGTYYLDNVRIVENVMIKNGSFNAGLSGYEVYVDSSAKASYVVDSLSEDNAVDFTVKATGDQDWKIQLKQNNITLEQGHTYTLTFDAKCDIEREIRAIMQGGEKLGWPVYCGENIVSLTSEYQTFTKTFTMEADTDTAAFLSICLGAVNGNVIDTQHRVCIDNISLVEVEED